MGAAQRYIAKITLAAQMPGNGMGGSTKPSQSITSPTANPTKGYWASGAWGIWNAADKTQSTACGGSNSQVPAAPTVPTGNTPDQVIGPGGVMNGDLACSKMTSGAGTTVSNTATFGTVQPTVSQSGSGTNAGANPSAAGTAAASACPTQSGALQVANCLGTAKEPYTVSLGTVGSGVPQAANVALQQNDVWCWYDCLQHCYVRNCATYGEPVGQRDQRWGEPFSCRNCCSKCLPYPVGCPAGC